MDKLQRSERIAVLTKIFADSPGKLFSLGSFTEMFGAAKSTISEDIDIIQKALEGFGIGTIRSMPGASGGVFFVPSIGKEKVCEILDSLCSELSKKERILPGGYLYMQDIIYDPHVVFNVGRIFAQEFIERKIDCVVTVETKGIPLAFATANNLNVPLVIVRRNSEATDGASVNINYVSGSSRKLQTMVLSLKALKRGSRLLFIDDFMKGGGTARGIIELAKEFECELAGIGVLIATAEPAKKLVDSYFSLLTLNRVDEENGIIDIRNGLC